MDSMDTMYAYKPTCLRFVFSCSCACYFDGALNQRNVLWFRHILTTYTLLKAAMPYPFEE